MGPEDRLKDIARQIEDMTIRGARRIAVSASQALAEYASEIDAPDLPSFLKRMRWAKDTLLSTRPTAVSLLNGINATLDGMKDQPDLQSARTHIQERSRDFIDRSQNAIHTIGRIAANRIPANALVLTHCNSSVALSAIIQAHKDGKNIRVMNTESRPRMQGHITSRQLAEAGVPVTMILDSSVRFHIRKADLVIVGADAIASNGAVVNKIGTSQIALCAHEARVPFIVCAETYKFNQQTIIGNLVEIEYRDAGEIADPDTFPGVKFSNPAFDITPPDYIDAIATELGLMSPHTAYEIIVQQFGYLKGDGEPLS